VSSVANAATGQSPSEPPALDATLKHQPNGHRRGGAPFGNANRTTHGLKGSKLPPGCGNEENHVQALVRRIRRDWEAKNGRMTVYVESVLQRVRRAEVSARLAARWLRIEGDKLPIAERMRLLEIQTTSADTIEKCLRQLGLDGGKAASDPWAALDVSQTGGPAQ
jgi:hypothetical protein